MGTAIHDNRQSLRVPVDAVAMVRTADGLTCSYTIKNLSLGGALIVGSPAIGIGEHVHAQIHVRGAPRFALPGSVIRRTTNHSEQLCHALRFARVSPQTEDLLHDILLSVLEHNRTASILVVDAAERSRRALSASLRGLGCRVISVGTPLRAIAILDDPEIPISTVVVAHDLLQTSGTELMAFIAETYPRIRRVLVGKRRARDDVDEAIRSGVAHGAVYAPWTRGRLADAIRR